MAYEEEVELAPGIYLTKRKQNPDPQTTTKPAIQDSSKAQLPHPREMLKDNPKAYYEWILAEVKRIENSMEKLEYSNREMLAADPNDPVFVESIAENIVILERQRAYIQDYKKEAADLAKSLGLCFAEDCQIEPEKEEFKVENEDQGPPPPDIMDCMMLANGLTGFSTTPILK